MVVKAAYSDFGTIKLMSERFSPVDIDELAELAWDQALEEYYCQRSLSPENIDGTFEGVEGAIDDIHETIEMLNAVLERDAYDGSVYVDNEDISDKFVKSFHTHNSTSYREPLSSEKIIIDEDLFMWRKDGITNVLLCSAKTNIEGDNDTLLEVTSRYGAFNETENGLEVSFTSQSHSSETSPLDWNGTINGSYGWWLELVEGDRAHVSSTSGSEQHRDGSGISFNNELLSDSQDWVRLDSMRRFLLHADSVATASGVSHE